MKTESIIAIFLLFALSAVPLFSQDDDLDEFEFDSEPIQEESVPYFGLGVGYVGTFMYMNFDELNNKTQEFFTDSKFESPIFLSGVQGFTAIGVVPNLRVGIYGMGGASSLEESLTIDDVRYQQNFDLTLTYTALTVDYAIVPLKSLAILPGAGFGWGRMNLEAYRTAGDINWADFDNASDPNKYYKSVKTGFFYLQPALNIEYALTPFSTIRLGVHYSYSFGYDWTYDNNVSIKNVPDEVNANGLGVQFGIFVGLFN